ncbi:hypothetical protein QTO34_014140 [Cnephaeus nilssonii]|uniref:Uncharacterized protein n=1 Tax=Cnephaeus nilssonii TaxID=3371016 RepID=A0AA40HB03_CNENI|nr:hypothetical protein QTO34_014140 [Eptesicus nilssonii]
MSFNQSITITPHQRVHTGENLRSVVNVGKLLLTISTSLSTGEFTLEKSLEHNDCLPSFNTTEFTVEKSPKSVVTVGSSLGNTVTSLNTRVFTVVQNVMSVVNVGNLLPAIITLSTREFTLEKGYMCVLIMGSRAAAPLSQHRSWGHELVGAAASPVAATADSAQRLSVKEETIFLQDGPIRVTDLAQIPTEILGGAPETANTDLEDS